MNPQETYQRQSLFLRNEQFGNVRRLQTRSFLLTGLWSLIVLLALPSAAFAQSVLLDDAHTSTAPRSLDSNFGANPNLFVSEAGNVYIKFKLSPTLPAGTPGSAVERATLKLYLANVTTAGKLDVYAVAGSWDEATITARSAPLLGNLLMTTTQIGLDKRHEFLVIDITSLVQQWLGDDGQGTNGIANYGLALIAHSTDATTPEVASITFDSKENSQTSHEPQLNLSLQSSADGLQSVEHDATLTGDGTIASPLGIANGGINSAHLATDAVTGEKIAADAVTSSELADGAVTSPKITAPLSLTSADVNFTLSAANTGAGAAITATGTINTTTQYNIGGSRVLSTPGIANLVAGPDAGASLTSPGLENSFFGHNSGKFSTTAQFNSFFGNSSGPSNTAGSRNVFAGWGAGLENTTGGLNSFFGVLAGRSNATGEHNTHLGFHAGSGYRAGSWNTFIGSESGTPTLGFRDGNNNTALGYRAWVNDGLSFAAAIGSQANVSTNDTIVIGKRAGTYNGVARPADRVEVPGDLNIVGSFGANILNAATQFNIGGNRILSNAGASNLFAGINAGTANTTGSFNSFFGFGAGSANTQGLFNSFFGGNAGLFNTTGTSNSFFGRATGQANTSGSENSFFGDTAGVVNTTGSFNSFFGVGAGSANTVGGRNTFFGWSAGQSNAGGFDNAYFGWNAGKLSISAHNSFFGANAGASNTVGTQNAFFGYYAGTRNTTGFANVFVGTGAGALNTTGIRNAFFGSGAGEQNTTGNDNALFGFLAGQGNNGNENAFFGMFAGINNRGAGNVGVGFKAGISNGTGSNNTYVGYNANDNDSNLTNSTAIGANALVTQSNSLVLGSVSVKVGIGASAPKTKLHVSGGKIYVEANGEGVILKSAGGTCFELTVTDAGVLTTAAVTCP